MTTLKKSESKAFRPGRGGKVLPGAGPGRPKGVPNKLTRTARENIEKVFESLGGYNGMVKWAEKNDRNKTIFYSEIFPKLIPLDVNHGGQLSHVLRFDFGENGNFKEE